MKPTDYMNFVDLAVTREFANPQYAQGVKDTNTVRLPNGEIEQNPDGSAPLCDHRGYRIDKVGISYLCEIRWGVRQEGNVPKGIKSLDELAEHPRGQLHFYLIAQKQADRTSGPFVEFDKEGKVTKYAGGYGFDRAKNVEGAVKKFIKGISRKVI